MKKPKLAVSQSIPHTTVWKPRPGVLPRNKRKWIILWAKKPAALHPFHQSLFKFQHSRLSIISRNGGPRSHHGSQMPRCIHLFVPTNTEPLLCASHHSGPCSSSQDVDVEIDVRSTLERTESQPYGKDTVINCLCSPSSIPQPSWQVNIANGRELSASRVRLFYFPSVPALSPRTA